MLSSLSPFECIPITSPFSLQIGEPEEPFVVYSLCSNSFSEYSDISIILPDDMHLSS